MYGHLVDSDEDAACGNCQKVDDTVKNKIIPDSEVPVDYQHYDVYSDNEGINMVEKEDLDRIPYTRDCSVYSDGTEECRVVEGYSPSHWKESKKK